MLVDHEFMGAFAVALCTSMKIPQHNNRQLIGIYLNLKRIEDARKTTSYASFSNSDQPEWRRYIVESLYASMLKVPSFKPSSKYERNLKLHVERALRLLNKKSHYAVARNVAQAVFEGTFDISTVRMLQDPRFGLN